MILRSAKTFIVSYVKKQQTIPTKTNKNIYVNYQVIFVNSHCKALFEMKGKFNIMNYLWYTVSVKTPFVLTKLRVNIRIIDL